MPNDPQTLKDGEVAVTKADADALNVFRERYTPPKDNKYELKLPEKDTKLTPAHAEKTAAVAAKLGLSNAAAADLLPFLDQTLQEYDAAFQKDNAPGGEAWKKRADEWNKAALADPEIGGTPEKLAANGELAKRVLKEFFPAEMEKYMDDTAFGNNPIVLKGFVKLGRLMQEGNLWPASKPAGEGKRKPNAEVFFGEKKAT